MKACRREPRLRLLAARPPRQWTVPLRFQDRWRTNEVGRCRLTAAGTGGPGRGFGRPPLQTPTTQRRPGRFGRRQFSSQLQYLAWLFPQAKSGDSLYPLWLGPQKTSKSCDFCGRGRFVHQLSPAHGEPLGVIGLLGVEASARDFHIFGQCSRQRHHDRKPNKQ